MDKILATALGHVGEIAAEEKQLLLSRLLARLAHEIRNPLSSIDVHVQLLEEDLAEVAPTAREKVGPRLEIIHGELHRLENVVRQFLRLASPSAVELAPTNMGEIVQHVCNLLQPEAATRQIHIKALVPHTLPEIAADADQITQAMLNLTINALQAVEQSGTIEIAASPANECIIIEVTDSGPGIPPDRLNAIFEPYFTTKPGGSGIGLWIAQQIVLAHKGTIQASNVAGGGARFTVRLPSELNHQSHGTSKS